MAIDPSTITWDTAPQQPAGVSASAPQIDPASVTWDEPAKPKKQSAADFEPLIMQAAQKYKLDPRLLRSQIKAESDFNPNAKSPKGALGLMQLMPATAAELGVKNALDPAQNIEGGAKYMRQLLDRYGNNHELALDAYNRGMGNTDKFGGKMRPKETQNYIARVKAGAGNPDVPYPDVTGDTAEPAPAQPDLMKVPGGDLSNAVARTALGVGRGFLNDVNDAATQGMSALIPDPIERALSVENMTGAEQVAARENTYQQQRQALGGEGFDVGRMAGNIASPPNAALGISGAPAWVMKMGPKAQALMSSVMRGGIGAELQPVDPNNPNIGQAKAIQGATGAVLGPVMQGAASGIAKGVGKVAGIMANNVPPKLQEIIDLGKQFGVRLTAHDVDPTNKLYAGVEGALENIRLPGIGMVAAREETQKGAQAAAQKVVNEQFRKLNSMTYNGIDNIREVAAGNGVRSDAAKRILKMVDGAGDDEKAIMQASGNLALLRKKISADKLYAERDAVAGDKIVPINRTLGAIDSALESLPNKALVDESAITALNRMRTQLTGGTPDVDPIDAAVNQMDGTAPAEGGIPITYKFMRETLSDVRKLVDKATKDNWTDSSKTHLVSITKSIQQDLSRFEDANPALKAAATRADKFYNDHVIPYKADKLAGALAKDTPEDIYGAFIRQQAEGKGEYAADKFFKALDEKGRQAVRYGITKQAMENATSDLGFNATEFKKTIDSTAYGKYFRDSASKAQMDGLTKLFNHISSSTPEHLSKYSPVFNGIAGIAFMSGGVFQPAAAGGAFAGASLLRWLMTSEAGKRALLSTNLMAKGAPKEKMGKILDNVARGFGNAAASAAGKEQGTTNSVLP